ncbi:MAG: hypothetical protein N2A40_01005 [Desulfobulbaceae bacterium]
MIPGGASLEELLVLADTRMYAAKKRRKAEATYKAKEQEEVSG